MIGIIKTVLKLLELFLRLKVRSFYRDMFKDQKETEGDIVREIEKLRAAKTAQATLKADLLLARLLQSRKAFEELKTLYEKETYEKETTVTDD